jgi:hypothetical protein
MWNPDAQMAGEFVRERILITHPYHQRAVQFARHDWKTSGSRSKSLHHTWQCEFQLLKEG